MTKWDGMAGIQSSGSAENYEDDDDDEDEGLSNAQNFSSQNVISWRRGHEKSTWISATTTMTISICVTGPVAMGPTRLGSYAQWVECHDAVFNSNIMTIIINKIPLLLIACFYYFKTKNACFSLHSNRAPLCPTNYTLVDGFLLPLLTHTAFAHTCLRNTFTHLKCLTETFIFYQS